MPAALWRVAASAARPLLPLYLRRRVRLGKEVAARLAERRGEGAERLPGRLLWLHAASIGETLSILPLITALARRAPGLGLLVTTGTVTAAELLAQRLPPALAGRVRHRFVPLDVPAWTARFLDGWRPDAALFVESELWPNLIAEARRRGIPLGLVNARMSAGSARWWRRAPGFAASVVGGFRLVLAQSAADAARLASVGAPSPACWGNLKFAADALPADESALAALRDAFGGRPVLLGASTHPGEEEVLLAAHRRLAASLPDLLTVLVPRHPARGAVIAEACDLPLARRSLGALPAPGHAVYLADTLGELGLFYRLAGVALVGGALVPVGGHNPLEPARLGCPILLGPHTENCAEPAERLLAAGGAIRVDGPAALAEAALAVLTNPDRAGRMAEAAAAIAADQAGLPDRIARAVLDLLPSHPAAPDRAVAGST
ncbi:3-deoxy-D-manno-octulosonic acid transferase [Roseomonas sp. NAR14]|uniref:3-deoxy-D-manno-octulosonic acid transferase n=1 Tax=Roseomonas acroporae TaxID=2937791 RepID=A0A9X1YCD6_9PROT|nr:3-deoxy-D-manno-octulosonic acid transferase [Roseomonas acroporae]MCK8786425.1 3-deoxy-D-manno-octulosonic acid transferase [Roseomonas acroporae]